MIPYLVANPDNFDIDANEFNDRAHRLYDAALITRCYTQHAI